MSILFTQQAWEEYNYWQKTDKRIFLKINELIKAACRTPFGGIGKPEPLRGHLQGFWSRRINQEHRLVYKPNDDFLSVVQCRFHY